MQAIVEGGNAEKFGGRDHTLSAAPMDSNLKHGSFYWEKFTYDWEKFTTERDKTHSLLNRRALSRPCQVSAASLLSLKYWPHVG